jgi:hypothetical protein
MRVKFGKLEIGDVIIWDDVIGVIFKQGKTNNHHHWYVKVELTWADGEGMLGRGSETVTIYEHEHKMFDVLCKGIRKHYYERKGYD